jgi:polyisoprenoid-binding protein YceI
MKHSVHVTVVAGIAALVLTLSGRAVTGAGVTGSVQRGSADPNAWQIDSAHSAANFAVRHMLVSTVRGTLGPVSGTIWYDGKTVSSIRADVTIDVKKLSTNNEARDTHLRTPDFFAADQYPTMKFTSTRAEAGASGRLTLIGNLTIRETTKEVRLDVEGPFVGPTTTRGQRLAGTATTTIDRFDYGLKWNSLIETGGAMVGPDVKVTIDLQVTRPNAGPAPSANGGGR